MTGIAVRGIPGVTRAVVDAQDRIPVEPQGRRFGDEGNLQARGTGERIAGEGDRSEHPRGVSPQQPSAKRHRRARGAWRPSPTLGAAGGPTECLDRHAQAASDAECVSRLGAECVVGKSPLPKAPTTTIPSPNSPCHGREVLRPHRAHGRVLRTPPRRRVPGADPPGDRGSGDGSDEEGAAGRRAVPCSAACPRLRSWSRTS